MGGVTYLLAPLAVQEFFHLHEPKDGVLDPVEERPLPAYRACHRRVVLVQRRVVHVLHKDLVNDINLKSKRVPLSASRALPAGQGGGLKDADEGYMWQSLGLAIDFIVGFTTVKIKCG